MNKQQLFLITACLVATAMLFFFGKQTPPAGSMSLTPAGQPGRMPNMSNSEADSIVEKPIAIDFERLTANLKNKIPEAQKQKITAAEKQLTATAGNTPDKKNQAIKDLVEYWEEVKYWEVAAIYQRQLAQADSTKANWEQAAERLSMAFRISDDSLMQAFLLQKAVAAYKTILKIDTSDTNAKINLAACYIDGYPNLPPKVMQGVLMLREITERDSTHIEANMVLARAAITSGQYDRALERLQRVIRHDPQNAEAFYFMGEVYDILGNKEKSIEAFKECKKTTKNPTFAAELDKIIKQLSNL